MYHKQTLAVLLVALCSASLFFTATLFRVVRKSNATYKIHGKLYSDHDRYTFVGDDFPTYLPVQVGDIAMKVEESIRFAIDGPETKAEWHSAFPDLRGSLRLGPDDREFFVSMYHEFHCLQQIHETLLPSRSHIAWYHLQHCFNYLRQWSLCQGDLTLEPGDFAMRNFTEDRSGPIHKCRDWGPAMSAVDANWNAWVAHWKELKAQKSITRTTYS